MKPEDFIFIKARLPKGYRETIKEFTGFSLCYIDKVMTGEKYNQRIVDIALNILDNTQQAKKSAMDKFNRIVKEEV